LVSAGLGANNARLHVWVHRDFTIITPELLFHAPWIHQKFLHPLDTEEMESFKRQHGQGTLRNWSGRTWPTCNLQTQWYDDLFRHIMSILILMLITTIIIISSIIIIIVVVIIISIISIIIIINIIIMSNIIIIITITITITTIIINDGKLWAKSWGDGSYQYANYDLEL
jgi:hypothetical protein